MERPKDEDGAGVGGVKRGTEARRRHGTETGLGMSARDGIFEVAAVLPSLAL